MTIAEIILLKPLDYERQNLYILTILAINGKTRQDIDTRNVHQTYLTIVVKDVQDTAPKFENLPQTTHIDVSYRPVNIMN
ncbi:hypothetical protein BLA29_014288 [Euroglyphus maynei]|uniref:Cadherin domain-containing protein n=1 Tax=Euroglyphus maynei TaxID=6958 RepID=A0A1Y3B840_EURMA|nr:hypothetical protein BLA29_014288 [Euroglyphus maynei]